MGNDDEEFEVDDLSDDGKDEQKDRFRYSDDPLTILGRLDDEQFQIASTFCFRRLADVKSFISSPESFKNGALTSRHIFFALLGKEKLKSLPYSPECSPIARPLSI